MVGANKPLILELAGTFTWLVATNYLADFIGDPPDS